MTTNVLLEEMTTQTPATFEIEKWLRLRVRPKEKGKSFFAGVDSGTPDPWPPLVYRALVRRNAKGNLNVRCNMNELIAHLHSN